MRGGYRNSKKKKTRCQAENYLPQMPKTTLCKSLHLAGTPQLGNAVKMAKIQFLLEVHQKQYKCVEGERQAGAIQLTETAKTTRNTGRTNGTHKGGAQRRPRRPATSRRNTRETGNKLGALPGRRRGEQRRNHGKPDKTQRKAKKKKSTRRTAGTTERSTSYNSSKANAHVDKVQD